MMAIEGQRAQISEALCQVIQAALPAARQSVKWNAPSFDLGGRDIITLNFPPGPGVRVVFHQGAQARDTRTGTRLVPDPTGRLIWASDQRAYAGFSDPQAVEDAAAWLTGFCRAWAAATARLETPPQA